MDFSKKILLLVLIISLLNSCSSLKRGVEETNFSPQKPYISYSGREMSIPRVENVRDLPNGEIIGETRKGEKFTILERRGNWFRVKNADFDNAFIWAPSFGVKKINLYSLETWFDKENKTFYSPSQFRLILGSPSERVDHFGLKRSNYFDIGLGREIETEVDQLGNSKAIVLKKGVSIIYSKTGGIKEILIDLKTPVSSPGNLSKLLNIDLRKPDMTDDTKISWENISGLTKIELFREEYKSDKYNQIALIR
jgi:hypothetical protein